MSAAWKKALVATILVSSSTPAVAAPHPGATSALAAPKLGVFRSPAGFEIAAGASGWMPTSSKADGRYMATAYKPQISKKSGVLTVRVDKLAKEAALDTYVRRWSKEYPKFGFDVLGSQPFVQNNERGYVLDLINRDNNLQLRQVIFLKKKNVVILTCRDQSASFKDTLQNCNHIIRTFRWIL